MPSRVFASTGRSTREPRKQTPIEEFREKKGLKPATHPLNKGLNLAEAFLNLLDAKERGLILDLWYEEDEPEYTGVYKRVVQRRKVLTPKAKDLLIVLAKADYQRLKKYAFESGLEDKWMQAGRRG